MSAILDRIKHLPSTATGLAVGGVIVYVLKSWGCTLPSDWLTWGLGLLGALPGIFAKA